MRAPWLCIVYRNEQHGNTTMITINWVNNASGFKGSVSGATKAQALHTLMRQCICATPGEVYKKGGEAKVIASMGVTFTVA